MPQPTRHAGSSYVSDRNAVLFQPLQHTDMCQTSAPPPQAQDRFQPFWIGWGLLWNCGVALRRMAPRKQANGIATTSDSPLLGAQTRRYVVRATEMWIHPSVNPVKAKSFYQAASLAEESVLAVLNQHRMVWERAATEHCHLYQYEVWKPTPALRIRRWVQAVVSASHCTRVGRDFTDRYTLRDILEPAAWASSKQRTTGGARYRSKEKFDLILTSEKTPGREDIELPRKSRRLCVMRASSF